MLKRCLVPLFPLVLATAVLLSPQLLADEENSRSAPEEVQDLRYGVMLYHFFQQSYFDALTEALVGEQRLDMPYHQQSAKLLRGGMSLSYGMGHEAEAIFTQLLTTLPAGVKRDRAWFYLARLYYQRGQRDQAKTILANIEGELPADLQQEAIFLKARLQLRDNNIDAAQALVDSLSPDSPWRGYYYFNQGSKQTLAGEWQQGVDSFLQITTLDIGGEEGKTLKDRAYMASGFAHLGGGEYEMAIRNFLNVRLDSPLVEQAMLGYGWAAAQQQDFKRALSPWQALSQRSVMDASVQESLLAIPYAYEKLDAQASALQQYQRAVTVFEGELDNLAKAINVYSDLPLIQVVADEAGLGADWIMGNDYLPVNDQAPYLTHLIAQDHFQSAVKGLSDLIRIQEYLQRAAGRLEAMQGVLDVQRKVWQDNLSQAQREQYRKNYEDLLALKEKLERQQAIAVEEGTGRQFVSQEELELWQIVEHAEQLIVRLKQGDYDVEEEQRQLELYRGLLSWQASEQETQRRWDSKKQLAEVDALLQETLRKVESIESLDVNRYDAAFAARVDGLQQRLNTQQQQLDRSLQQSESEIRQLAITELNKQQQRLTYYLGQAKLAVARLYDAGSSEPRL